VLAILSWSSFVDERDVTDALFGSVAVKYFENSSIKPWTVRLQNGYWRPGNPPGLRAEVESSSGEATAIKSFWDGISNREH
jgi:hypothetical protein